jgi:hypothetical protein
MRTMTNSRLTGGPKSAAVPEDGELQGLQQRPG